MDSSKEMKTEVTKLNEMVGGSLGTIVSGTDEKTDKICANIEENTKLYSASKSEYDQTSERNNCESVEMNSKKVDINNEVVESDVQKGSNLSELCNKTHVSAENIQGSSPDGSTVKMEVNFGNEAVKEPPQGEKSSEMSVDDDTLKIDEVEEEFKGFPVLEGELKNQDLVKNLSQREENELQEMEVFVQKNEPRQSPYSKRKRKEVEESDLSSHCSSPALSVASQLSVLSFTKRSRTGSPASKGSRKSMIDLSNPKYLVPFEYGWKREVVTRAITSKEDGISKDIYYFHPSGKKLRSLREVSEKLTPGLTIENFTFYKEPLGAEPQFETIRNARCRGYSPFEPATPKSVFTPTSGKTRSEKSFSESTPVRTPIRDVSPVKDTKSLRNFVKTPKESATKQTPAKREKIVLKFNKGTPKIALKKSPAVNGERRSPKMMLPKLEGPKPHPNAPSGPRRKITPRKKPSKPPGGKEEGKGLNKSDGGDLEMGMLPPLWSPTAGSNKSSSNESLSWSHLDEEKSINEEGRMHPCTIRCTKAMGLIPTLQCSVCLCLYHPECCDVPSTSSYHQLPKYVCKNCQTSETKSRNLVKHITPALVTDQSPPIISPKPIHPGLSASPTIPTGPSNSRMQPPIRPKLPNSKSVLGGGSQWFPPTNSVFRSPSIPKYSGRPDDPNSPPQALINMNNKRYIVVPKNNVLSVNRSPTKSEPPQSTTIITPTPTSTIIQGPPLHHNPFVQPIANSPGIVLVPFMSGEGMDATQQPFMVVNPPSVSSATANSSQADLPTESETTDYFPKRVEKFNKRPSSSDAVNESMQKFMRNICIGYSALLNVFQYLKVQELLRAGRVCRLWRDLASHSSLWRTVRMKNSQVSDWKGFTDSLSRHGTKHLDLRKMLMSLDDAEEMWAMFAKHISGVKCLERLDICRCSVNIVAQIMEACPQLLVFNAQQMIGVKTEVLNQKLSLDSLSRMKNLKELRLKSFLGLHLTDSLKSLTDLSDTLTTLSLTSVKNLGSCKLHFIGKLQNLEALELGECSDLPETFPHEVIAKLTTLKRIRLEKGPWSSSTNEMLYQMSKLKDLVQLELINFDVKPGFDKALASCTNIKRLLLIPTYVTQSATTNNIILSGTYKLWKSLSLFVWVLTMELLKVTELFVDQCEEEGCKKSRGNSVPVLKPVPLPAASQKDMENTKKDDQEPGGKNPMPITIIPIDELFGMLTEALPSTKVKLLKIPFQNTWRQSITEGGSA
ncbi:hypothetical protein RUM44_013703 [Polyplax serrata]|uniref:MBD domain-containing protein n=1 Tax=Polyplax serrata TaxID=468196 RepID=A0ABR1BH43_POLSC